MEERRHIPRAHYPVFRGDRLIGEVTSGTFSPILQRGIALAYLWPGDVADVGSEVEVDIRGRRGRATVVKTPFVDRSPR
jgi:aminomethyltransferase